MELTEFAARLDDRLDVEELDGLDYAVNGLQVGPEDGTVDRAAFAVDGVVLTVEEAAAWGADVLVVHHGVSWGDIERVTGRKYRRIAPLVESDLALYAAHLPLDGHPELGNAAGLADLLELTDREPFGEMGPVHVGQHGRASDPFERGELAALLDAELDTGGRDVQVLDFGPETVEDVAVVTGSGVDWLDEAVDAGADLLITGEGKQYVYHEARESGINLVLGGHYATETFGVRNLQETVEQWGIETTFIDCPTGL